MFQKSIGTDDLNVISSNTPHWAVDLRQKRTEMNLVASKLFTDLIQLIENIFDYKKAKITKRSDFDVDFTFFPSLFMKWEKILKI